MLKGIPKIISPDLIKILSEMGHGDYICIGDGNFPGESMGENSYVVHMEGHNVPEILDAVLSLIPVDTFVEKPVSVMAVPENEEEPVIWKKYREILDKHEPSRPEIIEEIERFAFYDKARGSYCIIQSSEAALYANIIVQKGVIKD